MLGMNKKEYLKKKNAYFKNMDEIETFWKFVRQNNFSHKKVNEALLRECKKGREIFCQIVDTWKKEFIEVYHSGSYDDEWPFAIKVAAYERTIMFYEKQSKWKEALEISVQAMEIGIGSPWYVNRINKLKKKISESS